jgi:hypothetical protein
MCVVCGQPLRAHGNVAVTADGLAVHSGTCHSQWVRSVGFERLRWIDRRRLANRSSARAPRDGRSAW